MPSLLSLYIRRNIRFSTKIFFLSFLLLLFPSIFIIGSASFERVSLHALLSESTVDYEIQGTLQESYSSNNLSLLVQHFDNWAAISTEWNENVDAEGFLFLTIDSSSNTSWFLGIDFFSDSIDMKKAILKENVTTVFGTVLNIENFLISDSLPFDLDLIISINTFTNLQNTSFIFSNAQIGYYVDLSSKKLSSQVELDSLTNKISHNFRREFIHTELLKPMSIKENNPNRSEIHPFEIPFDAIILLISFISMLSTIWLIEHITRNYIERINSHMEVLQQRGLSQKQNTILQIVYPIMLDTLALLMLCLIIWIVSSIFSLNLLLVYVVSPTTYFLILYRRIKVSRGNSNQTEKSYRTFLIRHIIGLLIISLLSLIVIRSFGLLLPLWMISIIKIGVSVIQYYILTLLSTELLLFLIELQFKKLKRIAVLINKILFSKKSQLRTWFHTLLLLTWSLTIITASIQSFNTNYELDQTISNITDIQVDVSIPLHNVSLVNNLPEVEKVLPFSHSEESYFVPYDLHLVDLTLISAYYPELMNLLDSFTLNTNVTYISEDIAKEFSFQNGDLFPTKFGYNITNIIVNQPIIITKYFPMIKATENMPFVVSSYRYEFENITVVNRLYIDFIDNITLEQGTTALRSILGSSFQIKTSYSTLKYRAAFSIYQYTFLTISLIIIGIICLQFFKSLNPIYNKLSTRGMQRKVINLKLFKQFLILIVPSFILSVILSVFFIFVQMPNLIYQINLFAQVQINIGLAMVISLSFPLICIVLLVQSFYLLRTEKNLAK